MLFGGVGGEYPSQDGNDVDIVRVKKEHSHQYIYALKDTKEGPLVVVPPTELMRSKCMFRIIFIFNDKLLLHWFWVQFCLP